MPPGVCEGVREGKIYAMGFEGLIRSQKEKVEYISNIGVSVHKGTESGTESYTFWGLVRNSFIVHLLISWI